MLKKKEASLKVDTAVHWNDLSPSDRIAVGTNASLSICLRPPTFPLFCKSTSYSHHSQRCRHIHYSLQALHLKHIFTLVRNRISHRTMQFLPIYIIKKCYNSILKICLNKYRCLMSEHIFIGYRSFRMNKISSFSYYVGAIRKILNWLKTDLLLFLWTWIKTE